MAQLAGTPIILLKEGTERSRGRDAQRSNITASMAVAEAVRSTLGPRGMDKLLVDNLGDVIVTNDGATILDELDVQHPAAKMLVNVAKTQDQETGDGTTTAVVLAGELLKRAQELIEKKVHPTIVVSGYKKAAEKARNFLQTAATEISPDDLETLKKVARTSMNSKSVGTAMDHFANIAVNAVKAIQEDDKIDIDLISVIQKQGKSLDETEYVEGIVVDKEVVSARMPTKMEDAKIALLNLALEIKKPEFDSKIRIEDPTQVSAFLDEEDRMLQEMVEIIKNVGANVVICQKGIDDLVQHYLAKVGILAARRAKKSDMEKLAKATGGRVITDIKDLTEADLGSAGIVEQRKIGDDKLIYVQKCQNPKAVSIVIRGANKYVTDEAERSLHDALCVVRNAIKDKAIVAGGGAPEIETSRHVRDFASTLTGREQLAVTAFADALEIIPKTLTENAGLDTVDTLIHLRAAHEKGEKNVGVDVIGGDTKDMFTLGVVEPLSVKQQVLRSASEASELILRIDDVINAKDLGGDVEGMPPGGMPPGMGGMGGMGGMPPGMM